MIPARLRPHRLLILILALSAVLAGCARTNGERAGGTAQTTLRFWNGFTGPDGKTMEKIVRQFQVDNPDVAVRMQIIPWGTYYDKLTLSLAYGGAPDVFVMHAARLPEFASFGTLRPLADHYAEEPRLRAADFAPVPWRATFYGGQQFALPLDVHPIGLYCNTRLFKAAGIVDAAGNPKAPHTWDEFLADAKKMTRDTDGDGRPDEWGFVYTLQRSNMLTFFAQFGASILTPDMKAAAMDSPQAIQAAERMRDLIYTYHVAPKPEGVDAWLAFRQGKVGMAMEGIYMLTSLEEEKGLEFFGAPAPQFGPRPGCWGGSHLLCQPAGIQAAQSAAAWRLMRYLSDHSLTWAKGGQTPARRALLRSPEFAAMPVQAQFARQLPYVQYEPLSPRGNSLFQFADPAIEAVLLDLQTPEVAMRDASRRINQLLRRP
jgi:multiple sugar transport system substrate-binding protein